MEATSFVKAKRSTLSDTATSAGVDPATGQQLYWVYDTDADGVRGEKYVTTDMAKATKCKDIQGSRIPDVYGSVEK